MGTMDRLFGTNFFTSTNGGMDMLWANLFWVWGHPEVYILILPAFGIYSEIISTFSRRNLYGYKSMVGSIVIISVLSLLSLDAPFLYNGSRGIGKQYSSPLQQWRLLFQQGLRYLTGCLRCGKGKSAFTVPMLYSVGFIPLFTIGGVTGVMLAMSAADYQYHNTMFLVAHFHNTIIPGVVFAMLAGLTYYWPKMFGFHA